MRSEFLFGLEGRRNQQAASRVSSDSGHRAFTTDSSAPPGQKNEDARDLLSIGSAWTEATGLHQWLHPVTPIGVERRRDRAVWLAGDRG